MKKSYAITPEEAHEQLENIHNQLIGLIDMDAPSTEEAEALMMRAGKYGQVEWYDPKIPVPRSHPEYYCMRENSEHIAEAQNSLERIRDVYEHLTSER